MPPEDIPIVTRCTKSHHQSLIDLLQRYSITIEWINDNQPIPGSHFGEPEAGLIDSTLFLRQDTPIHSALHEACHFICMEKARRDHLHTDAGGDYDEENAVCYLSILLAESIDGFGAERMMADMDAWGYTFRLGNARSWFTRNATDAEGWLRSKQIIDAHNSPTWQLRGAK